MKKLKCSISLVLMLIIVGLCSNVRAQVDEPADRAQDLYRAGRYEEAIEQLKIAYDIKPRVRILYNIAMAYSKLRRYLEAGEYFKRYLAEERELTPQQRQQVEALIARAKASQSEESGQAAPPNTTPPGSTPGTEQQSADPNPKKPGPPAADPGGSQVADPTADDYERAKRAYQEGRYDEAIDLLKSAYQYKHRSRLLYNIGMSYWKLKKYYEASAYLQRFLGEEPQLPEETRKQITDLITQAQDARRSPSSEQAKLMQLQAPSDPAFERAPERTRSTPIYKRWWLWALVAVGAVGITAAVVVPLSLPRGTACDRNNVDVCGMPSGGTSAALTLQVTF